MTICLFFEMNKKHNQNWCKNQNIHISPYFNLLQLTSHERFPCKYFFLTFRSYLFGTRDNKYFMKDRKDQNSVKQVFHSAVLFL